ncbi:MAG TPA: hypothetical protein VG075_04800 [Candidatus Acidoferrum sp.]|nr:hypothetical protein [Candidatus Acidoferrum sp.]
MDIRRYGGEGAEVKVIHAANSLSDAVAELKSSEKFREWKPSYPATPRTPGIEQSAILKDERHFTPQELADMWRVSVQTVREIFQNEDGVLKIGRDGTRTRRRYKTLRIPESVVERVHTRLSA